MLFALGSLGVAAQPSYNVGDKVEVRDGGKWYRAEILDSRDGKFLIHYDGYDSVMDVWTTTEYIRRIDGVTSTSLQNGGGSQSNNPSSPTSNAPKFKPGDRVECDKAQIGVWEKGTVMPFSPDDPKTARFYRVRLDSLLKGGLYGAGIECQSDAIRPLNEPALQPSGKYKVGDRIEAQNSYLTWLPARIIAIEGAFYKVRFDNRDERYDESLDDTRIRTIGGQSPELKPDSKKAKTTAKPTRAIQLTSGTAWSLRLYRKKDGYSSDGTVQTMLFCPNGTWDTVRSGFGTPGAVGQRGTYKIAGKSLTLKNGQGGQTERYAITALNAGTYELNDGSDIIWRLFDGVKTTCRS